MDDPSLEDRVARWVRPEIRNLSAYQVPAAGSYVKLDAMENPYDWPGELVEEWLAELRRVSLNRYPDAHAGTLKARIREAWQVPADAGLLLGNGSDELIQMIDLALGRRGAIVCSVEPSFVMYQMIASVVGTQYVGVPLTDEFELDGEAMEAAIGRYQPAVVYLAYPNNPTGNLFDEAAVQRVIEAAPGLVVVDEAYLPFAQRTLMGWLADYDNLLILRTVSKLGLAGLRVGVLIGAQPWLREIDKTRLPYNINTLSQLSADFALRHAEALEHQAKLIRAERERLYEAMEGVSGVTVYPSDANFLLFRVGAGRGHRVFEALKGEGVLIKDLGGAGDRLADCLRVTVGRPEENERFLSALEGHVRGS